MGSPRFSYLPLSTSYRCQLAGFKVKSDHFVSATVMSMPSPSPEAPQERISRLDDSDSTARCSAEDTGDVSPKVPQTDSAVRHGNHKEEIALTDQTNLLPFRRILAVFGGLALCALVATLDSTIAATALPSISAHFKAGSVSSWVPSSYLLTSTAFQPLCECQCTSNRLFTSCYTHTD